jgi:hypothetical protein
LKPLAGSRAYPGRLSPGLIRRREAELDVSPHLWFSGIF